MSVIELHHPLAVRPPWPDELPRLGALARPGRYTFAPWLWVLVAGEVERIVGAASFAYPDEPGKAGLLRLQLRGPWRWRDETLPLIQAALAQARAVGCREVHFRDHGDETLDSLLKKAGFVLLGVNEVWSFPLAHAQQRLEPLAKAARTRLARRHRLELREPSEADLPQLRSVLAAARLQLPEGLTLASGREPGPNITPAYSALVFLDQELAAVLLSRRDTQTRATVQTRLVLPAWHQLSSWLNVLFLQHTTAMAAGDGITTVSFQGRRGVHDETLNLAKRFGGALGRTIRVWRRFHQS